jgi:hypothetical protein
MPIQTKPFDPAKAFDAMAENFRHQIGDMAIRARSVTIYRDMERHQQLESFMCGVITGLIGVCFAHIAPEGRDGMMQVISSYLPQARENVEDIIDRGEVP